MAKDTPQEYRVVDLKIEGKKGEDRDFVEPDLLLLGDSHLLMVEMKTRGGPTSSRNYPPNQLLNHIRLVAECLDPSNTCVGLNESDKIEIKINIKSFSHLILVPSTDPNFLENYSEWILEISKDGRLHVNPEACLRFAKKKKITHRNLEHIWELLMKTPAYYRPWNKLAEAYQSAVNEFNDPQNDRHWKRIGKELEKLAEMSSSYAPKV